MYLDNEEIILDTIQQISKDFGMFGSILTFMEVLSMLTRNYIGNWLSRWKISLPISLNY